MWKLSFAVLLVLGCGGGEEPPPLVINDWTDLCGAVAEPWCERLVDCDPSRDQTICENDIIAHCCSDGLCDTIPQSSEAEIQACLDDVQTAECSAFEEGYFPGSCVTLE
jgi:hypothetical protein